MSTYFIPITFVLDLYMYMIVHDDYILFFRFNAFVHSLRFLKYCLGSVKPGLFQASFLTPLRLCNVEKAWEAGFHLTPWATLSHRDGVTVIVADASQALCSRIVLQSVKTHCSDCS